MAAQFGIRLRKGAAATAVTAAVMAAVAGSQAPGPVRDLRDNASRSAESAEKAPPSDDHYYTDLPPIRPGDPQSSHDLPGTPKPGGKADPAEAQAGIPATVLAAYKKAEAELARTRGACKLPWQLLAAIGKVESGHAQGGKVDANGTTIGTIPGPPLNGQGFALIKDTDNGRYDGDKTYDRAVGPMQFIPSTWAFAGRDGNGDGIEDPDNVFDAALAAGYYLCGDGRDLGTSDGMRAAILSYNHSSEYLATVLTWYDFYRDGAHEVPDGTGPLPSRPSHPRTPSGTPSSPGASVPPSTPPSVRPATPPAHSASPTAPPSSTPPATKPPTRPAPPSEPPTTPPAPPTGPKPPAERVTALTKTGPATLATLTGLDFDVRPAVRALDHEGKPVAGLKVTFGLVGATDARFSGAKSVVVTTNAQGTATAPTLTAGKTAGKFTVRASLATGRPGPVYFSATVTEPAADALKPVDDKATFEAKAGDTFEKSPDLRASLGGKSVAGVRTTVAVLDEDGKELAEDTGPYVLDAAKAKTRALTLLSDKNGVLHLPNLHAGDQPGTYVLRFTAGKATADVELTVTDPKAEEPGEGGSASPEPGTGSGSPAA
ncbi:hypothetical protein [Streptomyces sp. SPB074]|uniref:lytic transglycosylase domain-containing protein n=1 Tax=Streptomyces sp. (strain SPB074) TaxID=465543 RepID=UPI00017F2494|nr:hypothetical protein [Streptomyces sp. SPB074]EDY46325.1 secreted protein [Streptomyces sp. SPB074]